MNNRKGSQREQDKEYGKCGWCGKVVGKKDNGIECELCEIWHHAECVDMSDEVYKVASRCEALHWFFWKVQRKCC